MIPATPPNLPPAERTPAQIAQAEAELLRAREDAAAVANGETVPLSFRGPPVEGDPTSTFVRLLTAEEYQKFYTLQADEAGLIAFVTPLTPEQIARLTPRARAEVSESALTLNFLWAIRWVRQRDRVAELLEATLPGATLSRNFARSAGTS